MSHESRTDIRDLRPEDREAAIGVLSASFAGHGPLDQVVGGLAVIPMEVVDRREPPARMAG